MTCFTAFLLSLGLFCIIIALLYSRPFVQHTPGMVFWNSIIITQQPRAPKSTRVIEKQSVGCHYWAKYRPEWQCSSKSKDHHIQVVQATPEGLSKHLQSPRFRRGSVSELISSQKKQIPWADCFVLTLWSRPGSPCWDPRHLENSTRHARPPQHTHTHTHVHNPLSTLVTAHAHS